MKKKVNHWIMLFEHQANRPWFPLGIAVAAFIDYYLIIIPMIAVLISSVMLAPKRWVQISVFMSLGSMLGVLSFSSLISHYGIHGIELFAPSLLSSSTWLETEAWIAKHGEWALFSISALPMTDHPSIAIVSLAKMPLFKIAPIVALAKLFKYMGFAWIASHAPERLAKLKWLKREVDEIEKS